MVLWQVIFRMKSSNEIKDVSLNAILQIVFIFVCISPLCCGAVYSHQLKPKWEIRLVVVLSLLPLICFKCGNLEGFPPHPFNEKLFSGTAHRTAVNKNHPHSVVIYWLFLHLSQLKRYMICCEKNIQQLFSESFLKICS